jgi:sterol desaturase/sphingolipid hydroxylase (fatty acid hydroxylase superfamily)
VSDHAVDATSQEFFSMPPIFYAVPVFMAFLLLELLASRWMNRPVYRLHDAVTSLNIGFISEAVRSLVKMVTVIFYALFVERVGTFQFDMSQPWVWVLAFFMYDFLYYWAHRAGHEVRLLWAAHVVHHSSEDFNLSTALRQSSTNQIFYWIFYVPPCSARSTSSLSIPSWCPSWVGSTASSSPRRTIAATMAATITASTSITASP